MLLSFRKVPSLSDFFFLFVFFPQMYVSSLSSPSDFVTVVGRGPQVHPGPRAGSRTPSLWRCLQALSFCGSSNWYTPSLLWGSMYSLVLSSSEPKNLMASSHSSLHTLVWVVHPSASSVRSPCPKSRWSQAGLFCCILYLCVILGVLWFPGWCPLAV